jgi:hypothetical protein
MGVGQSTRGSRSGVFLRERVDVPSSVAHRTKRGCCMVLGAAPLPTPSPHTHTTTTTTTTTHMQLGLPVADGFTRFTTRLLDSASDARFETLSMSDVSVLCCAPFTLGVMPHE